MLQILLIAFMFLYYGALITNGNFRIFGPTAEGLTFNSMLEHLLNGRFDVDPKAIGNEGFLRDGHVYAYQGIFCAVIRLPLLMFKGGLATNVTALSCLIAACFAGAMKLRAALFVRRHCQRSPVSESAFLLLAIYIVLGGAQVGYLRTSIYQEVAFWAAALGAAFVYCAVKGIILDRFTPRLLAWMALLAGLALLTRVSTGIGLYAAIGLLLVALVIIDTVKDASMSHSLAVRLLAGILSWRVLLPSAILIAFLAVAGVVNFFRWGNPATFVEFSYYISNRSYPDRLDRMHTYGLFNVARIPFSLGYFFIPVWMFQRADGMLLFEAEQTRLFDAAELPPGSFFLTDLLPIVFIGFLIGSIIHARLSKSISLGQILALAAGLAIPCILMLMAVYLAYRYRMEFYPEIDLLAFLGFYAAISNGESLAILRRYRVWIATATLVSIVSAQGALLLYKVSEFGPSQPFLREGVFVHYYWGILKFLH